MSEREEYTAETYPSFGKKYNGEKAIISLTSWKARINTVSKTLFSLLKQCPGFHIVLVLSEEEFPKMMEEMPDDLKLFADNEIIEFLWVYKNYKAFKKVLFTMNKYKTVPIISADDCIYKCNYAQLLYNSWIKNPNYRIGLEKVNRFGINLLCGYSTLFPPNCLNKFDLSILNFFINKNLTEDDMLYALLSKKFKIKIKHLNFHQQKRNDLIACIFHDTIKPLSELRFYDKKSDYYKMKIILKF